jgi:hypothetical protein
VSGSLKPANYRKPAVKMHDYIQSSNRRNYYRDSNSSSTSICSNVSNDYASLEGNKDVTNVVTFESIEKGDGKEIKNSLTEEDFEENDSEFDGTTVDEILNISPSKSVIKSVKPSGIPFFKKKNSNSIFSTIKKVIGKKSSNDVTLEEKLPLVKKETNKLKSNSSYGTSYITPRKENNFK